MPNGVPQLTASEALELHLSRVPWQWYVTLTFRGVVGELRANRALWRWLGSVRKAQKRRPEFVAVTEYQRRGVVHFHLLMLGVELLRRLTFKNKWERNGHARVLPYDPARGAAGYVGKYLFKDAGNVQVSRSLSKWLPDRGPAVGLAPDSPTLRTLATVFDVGQGEQLITGSGEAGNAVRPCSGCGREARPGLAGTP